MLDEYEEDDAVVVERADEEEEEEDVVVMTAENGDGDGEDLDLEPLAELNESQVLPSMVCLSHRMEPDE